MISIVMPTYNREAYLAEAIGSVLSQTYKDWELIIVDDGSTDDTSTLINHYKDKRIRYLPLDRNRGIAYARNYGIKNAKGEYIAVMDSDDLMSPNRLKLSLKAIKNVDFVYGAYYIGDDRAMIKTIHQIREKIAFENIKANDSWPHVTIMAHKVCFLENPYREEFKVNDDSGLVWDWFKAGYKNKAVTKEPLCIVRYHATSVSKTRLKELNKVQEILNKEYDEFQR